MPDAAHTIGLIAPTVEVANRAREVARALEMDDQLLCRVGNHLEGVAIAQEMEREGAEVLVSRRSTATLIEKSLRTPNVSIPITLQDIAQALHNAQVTTGLEQPSVALFIMPYDQPDVESFAEHLHFNLHIYPVTEDEDYLALMLDRAIADKMDVVIAGSIVTVLANARKFPCVFMDTGPVALRTALLEARQIAYARKLEKTRAEVFRIIVNSSYAGIIVVDQDRKIYSTNQPARNILGAPHMDVGTRLKDVLPELDLESCFNDKDTLRNVFLQTAKGALVLDATPFLVGGSVQGVAVTFQAAESVTELGNATRKNLHSQGFTSRYSFASIVGDSPQIAKAKDIALEYAAGMGAVLLAGETGTGKELFAHAIHGAGPRRQGPFIPINCAAIPAALLEAELFGHEEGAFTGAVKKGKPGLFEMAHQGTVFLDEISELGKQAQLRLLRVLQESCVMRLGGNKLIPIDIRIIAATNRNLWEMVEQGDFRKDLYYRLNVLPLFIPALRHRNGDVAVLARHFLQRIPRRPQLKIGKADMRELERHSWPGNVRELGNVIERLATARGGKIQDFLHPHNEWKTLDDPEKIAPPALTHKQLEERKRIVAALEECGGHKGRTAELLDMNRVTLFRKIRQYAISE